MALTIPTHYNQPPANRFTQPQADISIPNKTSTPISSDFSSGKSDHAAMMRKQEMLSKTDLAPDWVWEYGIMG